MRKYSKELKLEVVKKYLDGNGSHGSLAKEYGVPSRSTIERWISLYRRGGEDSINPPWVRYTSEEKLRVVKLYLNNKISYQDLARKEQINSATTISKWVKIYKEEGPDAFDIKKAGHQEHMSKDLKPITSPDKNSPDYLKQLEQENLYLRIQNDYLKEKRRLCLQEEVRQKQKRE